MKNKACKLNGDEDEVGEINLSWHGRKSDKINPFVSYSKSHPLIFADFRGIKTLKH